MTSSNDRNASHSEPNLVRRTLRTVGLLVAACVIFVGVLSVVAVSIASRVVKPGAQATETNELATSKKPLSI